MDYEVEKELNELRYHLADLQLQISMVTSNHTNLIRSQSNANAASANNTNAQSNNISGTTRLQQIVNQEDQKTKKFNDNLKVAFGHSINSLTNLGGALVSSNQGLQKYSQSIESLGKSASTLGDNLGLVGLATGGLIGLLAKFASSILNLNQNTLDIRNNFAKAGGIIPTTTVRLGELAKEAGFALDSMKILGDKMAELSESMSSLGGYSGEGAIKFMQIANVEDKVRREFGRLGISQEELLNLQGMYVETQRVSGGYIVNQNKSVEEIQKESLQYAKTLMQLSSLTGESIETIQKEVFAARLEMREQARQHRERTEIARLRREGKGAEADELERRAGNRQKVITVLTAMYDKETAMQFATVMETGAITEETTGLAMLIPGVQGLAASLKHSTNINEDLSEAVMHIDTATRKQANAMSDAITYYPELAEKIGLRLTNLLKINDRSQVSLETIEAILAGKMQGTGENKDQLADSIEGVRKFERDTKKLFQTLLEFIDPMRNFSVFLIGALGAAAVAVTGLAVLKVGSGVIGGLFERGSSFFRPTYIRSGGLFGLGAGSVADPTGLGLRKADLTDKNGNILTGDALSNRLRKISEERTSKTTSFALKQAAKNSAKILKGAAVFAGAIAIIGAGMAGATWIMGGAIGNFAKGMKKFNEVDGDNLKSVGLGMAGLGAGVIALAAEKIVGFFNTLATAFGAQSPLERVAKTLQDFEKIDVDTGKIERNGKATLVFAKAFSEMPATTVSMSGMLAGFFSGPDIPYDKFETFAQFKIDVAKVENNSKAFIAFSNALATYSGYGAIDGLGAATTALADSVVQFYKIDPPEKRFEKFSKLDIEAETVKTNAIAFKDFAEGMSKYKGSPSILSTISSLVGTTINRIFGVDGPVEAFIKFSKDTKDISTTAAKNARAFFNFARAIGMLTGQSGATSGGILSGIISTITGDDSSSQSSEVDITNAKGHWRKDAAFIKEVERVSSKYGFSPGALIGLMQSESGVNPQSVNSKSGATGLIQFIPATARALGTSTDALHRMNRAQQMKYVDAFFSPYASGLRGASAGKLYAYVFLPGRAGRQSGILTENPEKYYTDNRGLDVNRDGRITISDLDRRIASKAKEAKVGGLFSGPTAGYPMELHGTELVVPVNSNSILMKLATEAETNVNNAISNLGQVNNVNAATSGKTARAPVIDIKRIESISSMFDRIIDAIDSTDEIDKKILRYA
jgi:hypothetical protein